MITPQTFYGATCDNCGTHWRNEHHGWTAMVDESSLKDMMMDDEWAIGDHSADGKHNGKHYCPECYSVDEDDSLNIKPKGGNP